MTIRQHPVRIVTVGLLTAACFLLGYSVAQLLHEVGAEIGDDQLRP